MSAEAEVASNQEQLIVAETTVRQAEDRLRLLIFDSARRDAGTWRSSRPIGRRRQLPHSTSRPPSPAPCVIARIRPCAQGYRERVDVAAPRRQPAAARRAGECQLRRQRARRNRGLPADRRLSWESSSDPGQGIGVGEGARTRCFAADYPTWAVGVTVTYPLGQSAEQANHARTRLEVRQAEQRVRSAEARVDPAGARGGVEGGDERAPGSRPRGPRASSPSSVSDVEQQRFEVGMSTSFLRDPGPARSRAGDAERARRGARLHAVGRRFRGAAAGWSLSRSRARSAASTSSQVTQTPAAARSSRRDDHAGRTGTTGRIDRNGGVPSEDRALRQESGYRPVREPDPTFVKLWDPPSDGPYFSVRQSSAAGSAAA